LTRIEELETELDYLKTERQKDKIIEVPTSRVCSQCCTDKNLDEFHRNKTRYLGRDYICKKCVSMNKKKKYLENKSNQRKGAVTRQRPQQMMSDKTFSLFYSKKHIREAIVKISIRYSKNNKEYQKDLQQYAWARIAMCQSGYDDKYYIKEAERAIRKDYKRSLEIKKYNLSYEESMDRTEWVVWTNGYIS